MMQQGKKLRNGWQANRKPEEGMEATPVGTAPSSAAARWAPSASSGRRRSSLSFPFPSLPFQFLGFAVQLYVVLFLARSLFVRRNEGARAKLLFVVVGPWCYQQQFDPISLVNLFSMCSYSKLWLWIVIGQAEWPSRWQGAAFFTFFFSFTFFQVLFLHFKHRIGLPTSKVTFGWTKLNFSPLFWMPNRISNY